MGIRIREYIRHIFTALPKQKQISLGEDLGIDNPLKCAGYGRLISPKISIHG